MTATAVSSSTKKTCLFICTHSPLNQAVHSGGALFTKANYQALCEDYDITIYHSLSTHSSLLNKLGRLVWASMGLLGGNSPFLIRQVKQFLLRQPPDLVFIDHSQLGSFAKLVKEHSPHTRVVLAFQNLEANYFAVSLKKFWVLKQLFIWAAQRNERIGCQFADKLLTLTVEDSMALRGHYGRSADGIIPITLDPPRPETTDLPPPHSEPYVLFCGSYFPPNIEGLKWYCREVLPHLPMDLLVVGFQMGKLREQLSHPKLKIIGTVASLTPYYQHALAVINPVQTGAGMNTKSVEAVAYGKVLVTTPFAVTGFPRPLPENVFVCEGKERFIRTLSERSLLKPEPNKSSQEYAQKHFSRAARKHALTQLTL